MARSHLSAQLGALSLRGPADKQPLRDIACELGVPRENVFFRIIGVARPHSLSTFSNIFSSQSIFYNVSKQSGS